MNFCNYCNCEDCQNGWEEEIKVGHALTVNEDYICQVCYDYDVCKNFGKTKPCDSYDCEHRPELKTDFFTPNK